MNKLDKFVISKSLEYPVDEYKSYYQPGENRELFSVRQEYYHQRNRISGYSTFELTRRTYFGGSREWSEFNNARTNGIGKENFNKMLDEDYQRFISEERTKKLERILRNER